MPLSLDFLTAESANESITTYVHTFSIGQQLQQSTGSLRYRGEEDRPPGLEDSLSSPLHGWEDIGVPGQLHHTLLEGGEEQGGSEAHFFSSYALSNDWIQLHKVRHTVTLVTLVTLVIL